MPIRRLTSAAVVAALTAILAATASAQFGNVLKKIPKGPMPAAKPTADSTQSTLDCSQVNDALLDKFLKALQIRKKVYDEEVAKANAKKAEADALAKGRGEKTVNAMMKNGECKDAFKEKDPRTKEASRLEGLVAAADDRGDQAKSDELRKKLDPLNEALELDADRACGGKGTAALHDCMERKTAELKKQGVTAPMLQIQAQAECMSDPGTSGTVGATAASPEEEAANQAYQKLMADAGDKANQAEKEAFGLDDHQQGIFAECVIGVLNQDPRIMSETTPATRDAIHKRAGELEKVLR